MTVGVFKYRERLVLIFEGWGILGTILLAVIAAIIPYGLCRGMGVSAIKAFFLTYALFYVLSWVKFPELFRSLGENNLGLINLGLLIMFVVAVFKMFKLSRWPRSVAHGIPKSGQSDPEISQEMDSEDSEGRLMKGKAKKLTDLQIRSVEDIEEALNEILRIIEKHRNNLPRQEHDRTARILKDIVKKEVIFANSLKNLRSLVQRLDIKDEKELVEMRKRRERSQGDEVKVLEAEIRGEEEKVKIERSVLEFENKLERIVPVFNQHVQKAMEHLRSSPYPYDAKPQLTEAMSILKDLREMLKEVKVFERRLTRMTRTEGKLLKKEKQQETRG